MVTQKEQILKALAEFDVTADAYWTEDGLPVLEAIQHMAKDATITRAMVTATAPGFSRENPSLEMGVVTSDKVEDVADEKPAETATEETAQEAEPNVVTDEAVNPEVAEVEPVEELSESELQVADEILSSDDKADGLTIAEKSALRLKYQKQQATVADEIADVVSARAKLEQELNRLYIKEENIADKVTKLQDMNRQTNALQSYFASENEKRQRAGRVLEKFREAGIDPASMLPQKSALDMAMRRSTKRGMKRPQPRPLL